MVDLVEQHRAEIEALCRRHAVARLELFGSGATGDFDPARSDLDFLVEFADEGIAGSARRYFGLLHDLEDLFRRRIDLVEPQAIRNSYFLKAANQGKRLLYAA